MYDENQIAVSWSHDMGARCDVQVTCASFLPRVVDLVRGPRGLPCLHEPARQRMHALAYEDIMLHRYYSRGMDMLARIREAPKTRCCRECAKKVGVQLVPRLPIV